MKRARVILADDHTLIRDALKDLLQEEFNVVGVFADGHALVQAAPPLNPDVIVLDVGMPIMNGLIAGEHLRQTMPRVKLIYLTMNRDPNLAAEAFRLGASGYLLKTSAASELVHAVREALLGGHYMTPVMSQGKPSSIESLTLEDKLGRALVEIVGGFCHDIGNDLHVCLMHLKDRRYGKARKLGADAEWTLNGLHQFVRQFSAGGGFDSSTVSASSIESVVREMCAHTVRNTNVTVHVESSGFSVGSGFPLLLLRHLIAPLSYNAAEAIASAKRRKGCIWVRLSMENPGNLFSITVEDNGIGWKGRSRVIEATIKNGGHLSTKGSNRGFGLQNIWRLASRIGGDIALTRSPRGGARVVVSLEMSQANRNLA